MDNWYFLAISRDAMAKTVTGYVYNYATGGMVSNTWAYTQVPPVTTNAVHIGHRTPGGLFWPGLIDDVAVWGEPLKAWQITGLAEGSWTPANVPIPEPSTLVMWALGLLCLVLYGWRKIRSR